MELMSSLLLCALVALPQTSGESRPKPLSPVDIKFNNMIAIQQNPAYRKPILLNINGPPLVKNISKSRAEYDDVTCQSCRRCMDQVVKGYKEHLYVKNDASTEELQDVLTNEIRYRTRRDAPPPDQTTETRKEIAADAAPETKTKKTKTKRNKMNKSVTVTKYNMDGEVYALRVKETQAVLEANNDTRSFATCQVYNVKKSYPCDSPGSDSLLAVARRKANKKRAKKQEQDKQAQDKIKSDLNTTSDRVLVQTSIYKKREVDTSQVQNENYMPSIEDLY